MMVMDKKIVKTFYGTQEIPYLVCMVPIIHLMKNWLLDLGVLKRERGGIEIFMV